MDRKKEQIERYQYDFAREGVSTRGLARDGRGDRAAAPRREPGPIVSDHTPEEYMAKVETVREGMRRGDYYEVVLRQTFRTPYSGKASDLFRRVQRPAPARTSSCCNSARSNWWERRRRCSCGWKGSAWRPAPSRARRSAPAIPLRDADNIRELLKSHQGRIAS